jgi:cell division protein DivIC
MINLLRWITPRVMKENLLQPEEYPYPFMQEKQTIHVDKNGGKFTFRYSPFFVPCLYLVPMNSSVIIGKIIRFFMRIGKNKYILATTIFLLWIIFFDNNNLLDRAKQLKHLHQLEKDRKYYLERIENDTKRLNELKTNRENLEKFAREQYLMKKKNEEIFVITKD